jgi:hypothetical protein
MRLPWLASLTTTLVSQSILDTVTKPTVYLIRHAEKDLNDTIGLNEKGRVRAQCLTHVFGPQSPYDIGYIIAQQPYSNGTHRRSFETVTPLAASLNLTVDTSCDKYDIKCAADLVRSYTGPGNILICWQHGKLRKIMKALGGQKFPRYPDDRNDIIWTASEDWTYIEEVQSECCPELDNC